MYQLYTLCIGNFSFEAEAWWYDSNCQTLQKKLSWFAYARGNPKMYFMYVKHVMGPAYEALIILAIVFVSLACLFGICFVQFLPVKRPLAHVHGAPGPRNSVSVVMSRRTSLTRNVPRALAPNQSLNASSHHRLVRLPTRRLQ